MRSLNNAVYFILVGLVPFVLTAACGDDSSPGDQQKEGGEPMIVSGTVADWSYGEKEVSPAVLPEVIGTISEAGEMSVTLPGSLSAGALKQVFPGSADDSFADFYWCGSGVIKCDCLDGITVSPAAARGAPVFYFQAVDEFFEDGGSLTFYITQTSDNTQIARVYADVATQVTGTCETDGWGQTFDLDLAGGWNLVEITSSSVCLEPGDPVGCTDYFDSYTIKSISQTDLPWTLE